jgi:hypothetical protein
MARTLAQYSGWLTDVSAVFRRTDVSAAFRRTDFSVAAAEEFRRRNSSRNRQGRE